jgi:hypothetical protein
VWSGQVLAVYLCERCGDVHTSRAHPADGEVATAGRLADQVGRALVSRSPASVWPVPGAPLNLAPNREVPASLRLDDDKRRGVASSMSVNPAADAARRIGG